jgi:Restriction endonuclease
MTHSRQAQKATLDFLPVLIAAALIGVFYLPGSAGFLGLLLFLGFLAVVIVLALATGAAISRTKKGEAAELVMSAADYFSPPPLEIADEEPDAATRALADAEETGVETEEPFEVETVIREPARLKLPPFRMSWRLELLQVVEWKRFADIVAAYLRELGNDAQVTRIGADGVVDITVLDRTTGRREKLVRCRPWDIETAGIEPVWEFSEELDTSGEVSEGAFFIAGDYSQEARIFARDINLDLVDGRDFLDRILRLPPSSQAALYAVAIAGDNITPTCPNCSTKMVLRVAGRGLDRGRNYWSCRNHPRCTLTFKSPPAEQ